MANVTSWFLASYKRKDRGPGRIGRYCVMDDYTPLIINQDGGTWRESECLGNQAVVKVLASQATLQTISADVAIRRLPKDALGATLADLTAIQKLTLRNWIEGLGYSRAEWQADLGIDLGAITLRQVLRFITKRRFDPRYDVATDTIILDGAMQPCHSIDEIDAAIV